uniref:Uncharacterized protein n=1 Tax=Anguilla anguilla TaxID=7936 RepID=A0A0E9V6Z1_ANGAN
MRETGLAKHTIACHLGLCQTW